MNITLSVTSADLKKLKLLTRKQVQTQLQFLTSARATRKRTDFGPRLINRGLHIIEFYENGASFLSVFKVSMT